jgi:hypothetical protein
MVEKTRLELTRLMSWRIQRQDDMPARHGLEVVSGLRESVYAIETDTQTDTQTYRQTHRHTDIQTHRVHTKKRTPQPQPVRSHLS